MKQNAIEPLAAADCSAWFAVADIDASEGGWFGPAATKEAAVKDMLSNWGGDPLMQCLVAVGYKITPETHPDLYDDEDCLSEWEWQVERPYEAYSLNVPDQRTASTKS